MSWTLLLQSRELAAYCRWSEEQHFAESAQQLLQQAHLGAPSCLRVLVLHAGMFMCLELVQTPSACRSALRPQSSTKQELRLSAEPLHRHQLRSQLLHPRRPLPQLALSDYFMACILACMLQCC